MNTTFDLTTESWIPVIGVDGERQSLGLSDVLLNAHRLVHIDTENPLFKASIFRVLLAILHRALDRPSSLADLRTLLDEPQFAARPITEYLDRWRERFDLFHPEYPFYQCAGLVVTDKAGNDNSDSIKVLLPEIAVGNNKTLFDHSVDQHDIYLSPAAAARALITAQNFALGGLARKYSNHFGYRQNYYHAPLVAGMPTVALGETLFETLVLNMLTEEHAGIPTMDTNCNVPVWERGGEDRDGETTTHGYLDYLTTQARHIRLIVEKHAGRVMVCRVYRTQGVAPRNVHEPWFFYRESRSKPGEYRAPQLDPDRSVWRECDGLLALSHKEDGKYEDHRPRPLRQLARIGAKAALVRCEILALANDQATPLYWRDLSIRFPKLLLADHDLMSALRDSLQIAEAVDGALQRGAYRFAAILLGANPDKQDVRRIAASTGVSRNYWAALDTPFRNLVANIDRDTWAPQWGHDVREAARQSLEQCLVGSAPGNARGYRAAIAASAIVFAELKRVLVKYMDESAA